jgi:FAD/FMN-containing dehydrogenase
MAPEQLQSWGRFPRTTAEVVPLHWTGEVSIPVGGPVLAHGLGRSYGDSCLNDGGVLLATRRLDRFLALDAEKGLLTCEAGVTLGEILRTVVPRGFFLPVVPGTKEVTVGGAIANDVHGKNHHRSGSFGAHVECFELLRSTGERLTCSLRENRDLFEATVGGLGLTGLVLRATVRIRPIETSAIDAETLPIRDLDEFFAVSRESDDRFEYTVAWIDCLASGRRLGRGILHRGNHRSEPGFLTPPPLAGRLCVPFEFPISPLNRASLAAFNALYHGKSRLSAGRHVLETNPFFFPLDGVSHWNRIYGRDGFFQFQTAVGPEAAPATIRAMLTAIAESGQGSFLAVLKNFGSRKSPGLLSFPRPGTTLALDFPNRGEVTRRLLQGLYARVRDAGGRIYPAKDALMPPAQFRTQHAEVLERFRSQMDPAFSSSLWRRVMDG